MVTIRFLVSGGKAPAETCSGCVMGPITVIMSMNWASVGEVLARINSCLRGRGAYCRIVL